MIAENHSTTAATTASASAEAVDPLSVSSLFARDDRKDKPIGGLAPDLKRALRFFHLSDTHTDPFFDPTVSMKMGVCHSCNLDTKV